MINTIAPNTYACGQCDAVNSLEAQVVNDLVGFGYQVITTCRWCKTVTVDPADEATAYDVNVLNFGGDDRWA